jgi:hypothetical protein
VEKLKSDRKLGISNHLLFETYINRNKKFRNNNNGGDFNGTMDRTAGAESAKRQRIRA